jgi:general secretion pathway protein J
VILGGARRAAGFTLIELLVALALTALVSLMLLHGIRLAATGFDRHTRQVARLDDRRSLDELLRRALASALPTGSFAGQPDNVRFVGLAEDSGPGLYRIDIARTGRNLVLRRRLAEPARDAHVAESILAADVSGFQLAYFGARSAAEEPAWHDRWEGLATLPLLVRVVLDLRGGEPRPPLVVPIWGAGS